MKTIYTCSGQKRRWEEYLKKLGGHDFFLYDHLSDKLSCFIDWTRGLKPDNIRVVSCSIVDDKPVLNQLEGKDKEDFLKWMLMMF